MVVIFILGVVSLGVSFVLPNPVQQHLQQEGRRLVAMLETARTESRSRGIPIWATSSPEGLWLQRHGLPDELLPWLKADTHAQVMGNPSRSALILGPEPIIVPQRIRLWHQGQSLILATDGIGPFKPLKDSIAP